MKKAYIKYSILLLFVIQIAVPAIMIIQQENIIKQGYVYKFIINPVDPTDPFRGKYIILNFDRNDFYSESDDWEPGEEVFVTFENNSEDFAVISDVNRNAPAGRADYYKTKILSANGFNIEIEFSFNKYYMEESLAPKAEKLLRFRNEDVKVVYATVSIKDGSASLTGVFVNDIPIADFIENQDVLIGNYLFVKKNKVSNTGNVFPNAIPFDSENLKQIDDKKITE